MVYQAPAGAVERGRIPHGESVLSPHPGLPVHRIGCPVARSRTLTSTPTFYRASGSFGELPRLTQTASRLLPARENARYAASSTAARRRGGSQRCHRRRRSVRSLHPFAPRFLPTHGRLRGGSFTSDSIRFRWPWREYPSTHASCQIKISAKEVSGVPVPQPSLFSLSINLSTLASLSSRKYSLLPLSTSLR